MSIRQATRAYESWLRQQTSVVDADLRLKHARMTESPFVLMRATFYRWMQLWPLVCPKLVEAPRVLAVGDLHVENFGTWRDAEGRLIWGVNDVDEACELPYTLDLVRLATSALLAIEAEHFGLSRRAACDAILDGYRSSLRRGGRPVVLAERGRWLRTIALNDLRDPARFWARLQACPPAKGRVPSKALSTLWPSDIRIERVVRRVAGVGSLGRPRYVALASWGDALIAREAKACVPSAGAPKVACGKAQTTLLTHAVRVCDPFFGIHDGWIVRRLAPDCTRIELSELPTRRDEFKLLRAMGWETANLHLASRNHQASVHVFERGTRWLYRAARDMAQAVIDDWREWRSIAPIDRIGP
jgi:uncharacterized protein DUF2252